MNEYLLLSRGQWDADKSPAEIQAAIDAFYAWHARLVAEGRFKPGQRLTKQAKLVTRSGITDGPFTEAKEVIGGYWFVPHLQHRAQRRSWPSFPWATLYVGRAFLVPWRSPVC